MSIKRNNSKDEFENTKDLERKIYATLRAKGLIIPITAEEVLDAEALMKGNMIELPEELRDPEVILNRSKQKLSIKFSPLSSSNKETEENLARAAREDGNISPEIEERMRKDREAAEKKHKNARE